MKKIALFISIVFLGLTACNKAENPPTEPVEAPKLLSCNPADGTTGLTGEKLTGKLTYDQNIKCNSSLTGQVTIDNGAAIDKINAYSTALSIDVSGLKSGQTYTLTVPDGLVTGFKTGQDGAKGITVSFTMKETIPEKHYELDPVTELSNKNASSQAKKVYAFLLEQSGKKILSGVQSEGTANNNDHVNLIYSKTGKHPAPAGYDFIFLQYSPTPQGWSWVVNYSDMSAPKEHWKAGGLVNYMWHWNVPNSKTDWENGVNDYNFNGYNFYSDKTTFSIVEAL